MAHRDHEYGIKPVMHGGTEKYQWTIYEKAEVTPFTIGPDLYLSHAEAEEACHKAIDDALERRRMVEMANRA